MSASFNFKNIQVVKKFITLAINGIMVGTAQVNK